MEQKPVEKTKKELTVHFVLMYRYYDAYAYGMKKIEYRRNTNYWRQRIFGRKYAVFHKGYSNITMEFKIEKNEIRGNMILVHIGERINANETG